MGNWLIHHELEREARWEPDHPSLVFEGTTYTYAELDQRVNQVAHALRDHGVETGDDVLVHGLNHADLFVLFFACSKLGAVYSTVSRFHSTRDVKYIIQDVTAPDFVFYTADDEILSGELDTITSELSEATFVCLDDTPRDGDKSVDQLIEAYPTRVPEWTDDHSPDLILTTNLTSGTTGRPKVALWDHSSLLHFSESLATVFPFADADRWLTTSDMMVGRGPYARDGIRTFMAGGTIHLLREFDPDAVVDAIR